MTLATLADVRALLKRHFSTRCRGRTIPRYIAHRLAEVARDDDMTSATVSLMIILALESVPCRPTRFGAMCEQIVLGEDGDLALPSSNCPSSSRNYGKAPCL
jgi:hypothetical protein